MCFSRKIKKTKSKQKSMNECAKAQVIGEWLAVRGERLTFNDERLARLARCLLFTESHSARQSRQAPLCSP